MKKLLFNFFFILSVIVLVVISIGIFYGLYAVNQKTDNDLLEEKIKIELAKEETVNDIFLDFKFGDTEKDVSNKLIKLASENKISMNVLNQYVYKFTEIWKTGEAVLSFEYFEGGLYKLTLTVDPIDNYNNNFSIEKPDTDVSLLWYDLTDVYKQKFGVQKVLFTKGSFSNSKTHDNHHWVQNNRMITISVFVDVKIEYVDLNIQSKVEQKEKKAKKLKNKKMQDDL